MLHLITAIIKPHMLAAVQEALQGTAVHGMTVTEVKGFGRQGGHTETYRGAEYTIDFVPKIRLDIVAETDAAETIAALIAATAKTGKIGDGKIWLTPVDRVMRIRTGEMGVDAL